ncbi:polysaccharide biosynthesis C-terminal domain-containing protein [Paramicrobacterium fandaimingii]|uniref:polysaccharide biosynthesis C-terminal domain-containing protein n=1 Tax=Paramicrobacterium fandaimingii TaxID=2708079 RepID=UPI00141E625D|nr:NAD-dependent epimerase/dehydratase family protein [Microbacterium fandaimingii]
MKAVVTGAHGFLGWHVRSALHAKGLEHSSLRVGSQFDRDRSVEALNGADTLLHLAGVNRGTDDEVASGNEHFARQIASVLETVSVPPRRVVFANSVQAGNGSAYGSSKQNAARVLEAACRNVGSEFTDAQLPNLFGEHGKPHYNSFVATFCKQLAVGERPSVTGEKSVQLLHAQDAADLLISETDHDIESFSRTATIPDVADLLITISKTYKNGEIPNLADGFVRDMFNTYRSYLIGETLPFRLAMNTDSRGAFVEVLRAHGGEGQTSLSTTKPGVTRGEHYHRRKVERFTVIRGAARISMRRLFDETVLTFDVEGDAPMAVDMPTMWAHNITNVGPSELVTVFWTNELFDLSVPDTNPEKV